MLPALNWPSRLPNASWNIAAFAAASAISGVISPSAIPTLPICSTVNPNACAMLHACPLIASMLPKSIFFSAFNSVAKADPIRKAASS